MKTHPFKRTHAPTLLCGVLVVLVALGACIVTPTPAPQPTAEQPTAEVPIQPTTAPTEEVVTPPPAPSVEALTFWAPGWSQDDITAIDGVLKDFQNQSTMNVKVEWHQLSDRYYQDLSGVLAAGEGPDLAVLPLPVPEDFGKDLGVVSPWLLCNSRLLVSAKSEHPDEAAKLLEYLTNPVCYEGLPITLVPYATPPPPPEEIIGQAEYVPGDPVIVEGVAALKDQLIAANATINVARAVVLTYEGETTYMAPVGIPLTQGSTDEQQLAERAMKDGVTIAMVVVKPGVRDLNLPEGAYLVRDFLENGSETWTVSFIDVNGESVAEIKGVKGEKPLFNAEILAGLPSAGIYTGSKLCRSCKCAEYISRKCVEWTCQTYPC